MDEILSKPILGNPVGHWLLAFGVAVLAVFALFFLRGLGTKYLPKLVARTGLGWDEAIVEALRRTHGVLLLILGLLIGSQVLAFSDLQRQSLLRAVAIALVLQGGIWTSSLVRTFADRYRERKLKDDPSTVTTVQVAGFLVRIALWILVFLLVLANLGIEITPLLAGLGVGGLAMALAVQAVLKDLLASLSILLDKPFVIGDFLNLGDEMGTVEHIGLRTTRLRSLAGEQLVLSNADLLESRIRNFGRMRERRVVFAIGVTYQTPRDKLIKIPTIIREAVESQKLTRFDRSHLKEFGDFSVNFETVFYVGLPDYTTYMDIRQAINLRLYEVFEQESIEFAYPTQTLFLTRQPAPAPQGGSAEAKT